MTNLRDSNSLSLGGGGGEEDTRKSSKFTDGRVIGPVLLHMFAWRVEVQATFPIPSRFASLTCTDPDRNIL